MLSQLFMAKSAFFSMERKMQVIANNIHNAQTVGFKNINWRHDKLNRFGSEIYLPRYSSWYGDSDKPYTYSGLTLHPNDWNEGLLFIKKQIEIILNIFIFINFFFYSIE